MQGSGVTQNSNFSALKLRYLSSVANHQARKVIDNNIALV